MGELRVRVGTEIRKLRQERNLSQEELCVRANLSQSALSLAESGKRLPNTDTLVAIAAALGVPPGALLSPGHGAGDPVRLRAQEVLSLLDAEDAGLALDLLEAILARRTRKLRKG